jgi:hypothetical protein
LTRAQTTDRGVDLELEIEELEARLAPDELYGSSSGSNQTGGGYIPGTVGRHVGWGC